MTPKERVAIALEHYTPDRVPSDFNLGGKVMIRHKGRKQIKIGFIGAGHPHSGQYMPFGMLVSDDAAAYISPGFYKDPAATNKRLRLLYFSCGEEDPRLPYQTKVVEQMRSHKIALTFKTFPGAHEWRVWRSSLADLAPLLFK